MQHEKYLYHFTCDESSCDWEIIQQQFGKSLYDPVMMYLPSSYGCLASVTTTTTSPTTTGTLTTTTQTTTTTATTATTTSKQLINIYSNTYTINVNLNLFPDTAIAPCT